MNRIRIASAMMLLAATLTYPAPAVASCRPPRISASATEGAPGQKVMINGADLLDGCEDVCSNGRCPEQRAARGMRILFVQGDRSVELARVDADSKFEIHVVVTIPADGAIGQAQLVAHYPYEDRVYKTNAVSFNVGR